MSTNEARTRDLAGPGTRHPGSSLENREVEGTGQEALEGDAVEVVHRDTRAANFPLSVTT